MNKHFGFNRKFSALRAEIYTYEHLYMKPVPERITQWGGSGKYRAQNSQNCSESLKTLESCTKLCRLGLKKILDRCRTPRYANHFLSPNHL